MCMYTRLVCATKQLQSLARLTSEALEQLQEASWNAGLASGSFLGSGFSSSCGESENFGS